MPSATTPRSRPAEQLRFAEALSEAITRRNLTLERISIKLREAGTPISTATLSYWQTGRTIPARSRSLQAVEELERLLRVPVGHLTSTLPRDVISQWEQVSRAPAAARGDLVLEKMGIRTQHHHGTEWVQDTITVSADRTTQQENTRQLIRATRDGMDRIPMVFRQSFLEEEPAWIQGVSGCELGRVVPLAEHSLIATELLLPHPLALDELWMLEYSVAWDIQGKAEHGFARMHPNPVRFHVLQVAFQCEPPREASYFTEPNQLTLVQPSHALHQPLRTGPLVQMALADPTPGAHGILWTF